MEYGDSKFTQKLFKEVVKDVKCMEYLNVLNNYPTWRVTVIGSLFPTMVGFLILVSDKKEITSELCLQLMIKCLVIFFACVFTTRKIIDYFRWHIMCSDGETWGCKVKKYD